MEEGRNEGEKKERRVSTRGLKGGRKSNGGGGKERMTGEKDKEKKGRKEGRKKGRRVRMRGSEER